MTFEAHLNTAAKSKKKTTAKGIAEFYRNREFSSIWVEDDRLSERAKHLLLFLSDISKEGLEPEHYLPRSLPDFSSDISDIADDPAALLRLEMDLTKTALAYARDVYSGRKRPSSLNMTRKATRPGPGAVEILTALSETDNPVEYLSSLAPVHEGYKRLKKKLAHFRAKNGTTEWTRIPAKKKGLKPGQSHDHVALVRKRLIEEGAYEPAFAELSPEGTRQTSLGVERPRYYDPGLVKAVKSYQKRHGIRPDGVVGRRTVQALNTPLSKRIAQVLVNMERYRWLPRELGKRHVFVNQTDYRMKVIDNGKVIHSARVIIGKPKHKTPIFSNEIKFVVFNPYWNVPRSIIKNEMLPQLQADPYFLERQGYEVRMTQSRRRSSFGESFFSWSQPEISARNIVSVRQPPGPRNALGRVKFLFPNRHHIYMHDTPGKYLFARTRRAFSHGCVRVQNANKFAEVLLKLDANWSPKQVKRAIASGQNRSVTLKRKVPVHLTYLTTWVDDDGHINSRPDIYNRDAKLGRAIDQYKVALK